MMCDVGQLSSGVGQGPYIAYAVRVTPCEGVETDGTIVMRMPRISHFNPLRPFDPQHLEGSGLLNGSTWGDTNWVSSQKISPTIIWWFAVRKFLPSFPNKMLRKVQENFVREVTIQRFAIL